MLDAAFRIYLYVVAPAGPKLDSVLQLCFELLPSLQDDNPSHLRHLPCWRHVAAGPKLDSVLLVLFEYCPHETLRLFHHVPCIGEILLQAASWTGSSLV